MKTFLLKWSPGIWLKELSLPNFPGIFTGVRSTTRSWSSNIATPFLVRKAQPPQQSTLEILIQQQHAFMTSTPQEQKLATSEEINSSYSSLFPPTQVSNLSCIACVCFIILPSRTLEHSVAHNCKYLLKIPFKYHDWVTLIEFEMTLSNTLSSTLSMLRCGREVIRLLF